jgi:hypothetical protein
VSARIVIYPRVNMGESRKLCLKPLLSRPIPAYRRHVVTPT